MKLLILPGDGIGPEIMDATRLVLDAAQARFNFTLEIVEDVIGFPSLEIHGTTIRDDVVATAKAVDGVILGPVSHNDYPPSDEGGINPSGVLRKQLDLYANIRPAKSRKGVPTPTGRPMDLIIVRENTEGFYADRTMVVGNGEFMPTDDLALAVRKVTRVGSKRIAEQAFALATRRRKKVTAIHKSNVLRISDGLYLEEVRAVAKANPSTEYEEELVDAMAAHLIRSPERFDVVVATNMFGDILSDEASELSGGLGLAASLNAGDDYAVAQAQHGSAPDIAGQGVANPVSLILSVAMLMDWVGGRNGDDRLNKSAQAIEAAVNASLEDSPVRTKDLGGSGLTATFGSETARLIGEV
ncbi:MAG: isocitrate/isopropylmalate dehydrogenase family protein [Rhodospirillaceae bacterium]|jgi:isocitrate/isopropylmalate dehydrogenase|nr:isocitrate/isopropylmalate dehydrogenase family protein [Rhodospirillaceae bacterium]